MGKWDENGNSTSSPVNLRLDPLSYDQPQEMVFSHETETNLTDQSFLFAFHSKHKSNQRDAASEEKLLTKFSFSMFHSSTIASQRIMLEYTPWIASPASQNGSDMPSMYQSLMPPPVLNTQILLTHGSPASSFRSSPAGFFLLLSG